MISRFLWGAAAGLLFAVMCLMAAVKRAARAFSRKQSPEETS